MKVDTIKGSSYVMTCTKACTVSAIFNSGETSMLILEADKKGQYGFAAPTDAVEVSDEEALITKPWHPNSIRQDYGLFYKYWKKSPWKEDIRDFRKQNDPGRMFISKMRCLLGKGKRLLQGRHQ